MKILLCMCNVSDTTTKVKFTDNNTEFDTTDVQWVINPWDELALTRAVELKEEPTNNIDEICIINVGTKLADQTIRKALAIGADRAIRVNSKPTDAYFVAKQIAHVVESDNYDLILCGIESGDYNGSSVGTMLAELLDYVSVSSVTDITIEENKFLVTRDIPNGKQLLEADSPMVAIVQKGFAKIPRIPSMKGIMKARKKEIKIVEPIQCEAFTQHIEYKLPSTQNMCKYFNSENIDNLVAELKAEGLI